MTKWFRDERVRQVIVGGAILFGVLLVTIAIRLAGAAPGVLGEWFGMIAGLLSTPVFLEVSFFAIGLMIVVGVNHWRMKREGDEFVTLDEVGASSDPATDGNSVRDSVPEDGKLLSERSESKG